MNHLKAEKLKAERAQLDHEIHVLMNQAAKLREVALAKRRRLDEINRLLTPITVLPPHDPAIRKRTPHDLQITPSKLQAAIAALPPELRAQLSRMT